MDKNYKPNHTLAYYKHRDENGCYFSIHSPKTRAGRHQIPMTEDIKNAFLLEKKKQEWKNRQEEDARFSSCFVSKILLHKYNESTYNKNIKRMCSKYESNYAGNYRKRT